MFLRSPQDLVRKAGRGARGDGDTSVGGRTDGPRQSGKENIVSFSAFCSTLEEVFRALKGGYKKSPENGRREDSRLTQLLRNSPLDCSASALALGLLFFFPSAARDE